MKYIPIDLPFKLNDLEPNISRKTIEYHYGKYYKTYINNLNKLIKNTEFEKLSISNIIKKSRGKIFSNASEIWNHNFYWNCLSKKKNISIDMKIYKSIKYRWGNIDKFKMKFCDLALENSGSGWTWLVKNYKNELNILNTNNENNPLITDNIALLVIDLWEHAYYIDYNNQILKYIEAFFKKINWFFVEKNFILKKY